MQNAECKIEEIFSTDGVKNSIKSYWKINYNKTQKYNVKKIFDLKGENPT